jgi:hypothetical protein
VPIPQRTAGRMKINWTALIYSKTSRHWKSGAFGSINIKALSVENEIRLEILFVHDLLLGS